MHRHEKRREAKPRRDTRRIPFTLVRAEPLLFVISHAAAQGDVQALAWELLDALASQGPEIEDLAPDATRCLLKSECFGEIIIERDPNRAVVVAMRKDEVASYVPARCFVERTVRLQPPKGGAR
jgi:hypothetical protein